MAQHPGRVNRRTFLVGSLAVAGVGAAHGLPGSGRPARPGADPDGWLRRLRGEDWCLFDSPEPQGARVLSLIRHYYDTSALAYGAPEALVSAVGTFYGGTTFHALDDAMWGRYELDQGVAPVVDRGRSPWHLSPLISGQPAPSASIAALHRRGAIFLLCRAALVTRAGQVAAARGLEAAAVLADMEAHILPEVTLVPSVIVAIQRAQRHGVSYYRVA